MDQVASGAVVLTWEPETRVAVLRFERQTTAVGRDAEVLVDAFSRWIGSEGRPFALLGDGKNLGGLDAEYRARWGAFFRHHRADSFVAFYNMGPIIRIAADMFRVGTGLRLRGFADEGSARAWLRREGIAA